MQYYTGKKNCIAVLHEQKNIAVLHGHLWQCVEFQLEAGGQQVDIQTILKFKAKREEQSFTIDIKQISKTNLPAM